ncbi:hypothetical protein ZWY2020_028138 [Hordeum vulgare]|nr:hypothetical protein ZWY2020_028138 [Hordeum vulgare]
MGAFPSPPPWGWSTGFITTPLTTGRLPSQHLDPALPKLFWFTPTLPTCPTVAKQFWDTKRTSPDGNLKVADLYYPISNCYRAMGPPATRYHHQLWIQRFLARLKVIPFRSLPRVPVCHTLLVG